MDLKTHEAVKLQIQGRHDPAIIHRARIVVDSVLAIGILDQDVYKRQMVAISISVITFLLSWTSFLSFK